jgi:hypothetical protein
MPPDTEDVRYLSLFAGERNFQALRTSRRFSFGETEKGGR